MPKIKYRKTTAGDYDWHRKTPTGDYDWHVVTSEGVVISGTVVKGASGWGSGGWIATITYADGERYVTPEGGRLTGHADTRGAAVERALHRYAIGEEGRYLAIMNT